MRACPRSRRRAEVEEETGYRVGQVERVFDAYMSPGSVTERLACFVAPIDARLRHGLGGGEVAEGEEIDAFEVGIDEALAMIGRGEIVDGKTIMLLYHATLHLFSC